MSKIDVSKCEYYTDVAGCSLAECVSKGYKTITNFKCKYNNCYYKQLQQLKAENSKYKQCIDEIEKYCEEQNLKYDTTACDILRIIKEVTSNE